MVGYGTFYEGTARSKSKEEYDQIIGTRYGQIVSCFSMRKNWEKLLSHSKMPDTDPLKIISGSRFFGVSTVIMVHTCLIPFSSAVENVPFVENLTLNPVTIILLANITTSIQLFFVLSGLVLVYHFFATRKEKGNVSYTYVFMGFIMRYIRLTPAYLVVLAFNATWLQHMNRGPLWHKIIEFEYRNCRKNWWANLLYINNFYDRENICMQHSWYLAADTQIWFFALFVTILLWNNQKRAKLILGTCLGIGILVPGLINYIYDYDILIRLYPEPLYNIFINIPQWHMMYSSSYSNISGYAIGLIYGYFIFKHRNQQILTKAWHTVVWLIITFGSPLIVLTLGILFYKPDFVPERFSSAIFVGVSKPLFAIGFVAAFFGASQNKGAFIKDIFFWRPMQPIGRLSYCVYLVHASFLRVKGAVIRSPVYASFYLIFTSTIENIITAYIGAIVVCLLVEMPFTALLKVLTSKKKNDEKLGSVTTVTNGNGIALKEDKDEVNS